MAADARAAGAEGQREELVVEELPAGGALGRLHARHVGHGPAPAAASRVVRRQELGLVACKNEVEQGWHARKLVLAHRSGRERVAQVDRTLAKLTAPIVAVIMTDENCFDFWCGVDCREQTSVGVGRVDSIITFPKAMIIPFQCIRKFPQRNVNKNQSRNEFTKSLPLLHDCSIEPCNLIEI